VILTILDKFWHQSLKRPFVLAKPIDSGGSNQPIVFLHGIGKTSRVWQNVLPLLSAYKLRLLALDLLGFGASPKPNWAAYDTNDHAQAVIASIEKYKLSTPVIIVGHSMGCLVAVRVAYLRPDLVKHLVLYEMPLYEGLPNKRSYRLRTDLYRRLYSKILTSKPYYTKDQARLVDNLAKRIAGQEVTKKTWLPFTRSLENTIMKQTTSKEIKGLSVPIDVIYGRYDMLVIRGKAKKFFGTDNDKIAVHTVGAGHVISKRAGQFLATRILEAVN
jgi:cis-3-alkyl-4-acyloxetan-2-one decarboxylase